MPVKGLDTSEKLLVVAKGDENLGVVADRLLEHREGALADLVLLQLADLGLVELGLGHVYVLAASGNGRQQA